MLSRHGAGDRGDATRAKWAERAVVKGTRARLGAQSAVHEHISNRVFYIT